MELVLLLEHTLPSLLNEDQVLEEAVRKSRGLPCRSHCPCGSHSLCSTHSLGKPNCLNFGHVARCAKAQTSNRVGICHGRMGKWRKAQELCNLLWPAAMTKKQQSNTKSQHSMLMAQINQDTHNFSLFYSSWWGSRYTFSKVVLTGNYSLETSSTLSIKDQAIPLCVSAVELWGTGTAKTGAAGAYILWQLSSVLSKKYTVLHSS